MSIEHFLKNIIKYFKHINYCDNYRSSILINKDLDMHLISYLEIDDIRCLYQVNKYYHNLLKDILTNFNDFYSKINKIGFPFWIDNRNLFNKSIMFGKLDVCKYIYKKYNIDIKKNGDESFHLCCFRDQIEIASWLCAIEPRYFIKIVDNKIIKYTSNYSS